MFRHFMYKRKKKDGKNVHRHLEGTKEKDSTKCSDTWNMQEKKKNMLIASSLTKRKAHSYGE